MHIALTILTALLALLSLNSAVMKLRQHPQVLESIHGTVGVPLKGIPVLAALEIAGAVGILAGLWVAPLGIAATLGLVLYFLGAVVGHLRVRDAKGAAAPAAPLLLSIAVLVLHFFA